MPYRTVAVHPHSEKSGVRSSATTCGKLFSEFYDRVYQLQSTCRKIFSRLPQGTLDLQSTSTFLKICPRLAKYEHAVIHTPNSSTLLAGYNCHISQTLVSLSSSPLSRILPECTASKPRVQAKYLVYDYRQSVACRDSEDMQTTLLTKLEGPGLHAFYRLLLVQFRHNTPSHSLTDYGNIAEAYRQI